MKVSLILININITKCLYVVAMEKIFEILNIQKMSLWANLVLPHPGPSVCVHVHMHVYVCLSHMHVLIDIFMLGLNLEQILIFFIYIDSACTQILAVSRGLIVIPLRFEAISTNCIIICKYWFF